MTKIRAAFYARVSGDQQAAAHTIESQIAALSERAQADGTLVPAEREFIDNGFSGATLIRPALDRLRDLVSFGAIDRIYVHSPDRLARNYAYQVLLIDEWRRRGIELVFLNRPLGQSPEDDLLLQVQGIVAEYERAKIMERSRRGKKHAAQRGSVNVMSGAPFGYRYVSAQDGGGEARFEPVAEQARVVKQMFSWIAQDRCSLSEVCQRLQKAGELTATGKRIWFETDGVARSSEPRVSGKSSIRENAHDAAWKGGQCASSTWTPIATTAKQQASGHGAKGLGPRACSSLD
jgi:site-specific DNA recombinase